MDGENFKIMPAKPLNIKQPPNTHPRHNNSTRRIFKSYLKVLPEGVQPLAASSGLSDFTDFRTTKVFLHPTFLFVFTKNISIFDLVV